MDGELGGVGLRSAPDGAEALYDWSAFKRVRLSVMLRVLEVLGIRLF